MHTPSDVGSDISRRELTLLYERRAESFPDSLRLRLRRAISWIDRAERCDDGDKDARFIFLWISLNSAYATEDRDAAEMELLQGFLELIVDLDREALYSLVRRNYAAIELLLDNQYIFGRYWDDPNWMRAFRSEKKKALRDLNDGATADVLAIVLRRLYTLRNQLLHGGATWQGSMNRRQVDDGAAMLGALVPRFVLLMMNHPHLHRQWGTPPYPPRH